VRRLGWLSRTVTCDESVTCDELCCGQTTAAKIHTGPRTASLSAPSLWPNPRLWLVLTAPIHHSLSNSMGSVVGPVSEVRGFHGAGPVRRALDIRRDITLIASVSSSLARCAPRQ
jgi:hypothetical protein